MIKEIIQVELISLKARLKEASRYTLNVDLQLECELLRAQIKALEKEYKKQKEK